jgi:putative membrane protein
VTGGKRRQAFHAGGVLATLAGLGGIVALVAYQGFAQVGAVVIAAAWGVALVTAFHLVPTLAAAIGWRAVAHAADPAGRLSVFLWARILRETVNGLLPVAQVGGNVVGARVLALHGTRPVIAAASMLVDLTIEVMAQIVFTVVGVAFLLAAGGNGLGAWAGIGLALAIVGVGGFLLAQRWGAILLLENLLRRLADRFDLPALASLDALHDTVMAMYRQRAAMIRATVWHLATWFLDAVEVWIALMALGADVSFAEALVIESLGQAIRSAAFFVPGAYGIQEGGYMVLGMHFGLAPEVALSVSLIKRARELLIGVPALLVWQLVEGRRLLASSGSAAAGRVREQR